MKNVEKVLLAIKAECNKQTKLAEVRYIGKIADRAGIPKESLSLYLNELQERGFIKYSVAEDYIYLTPAGKLYIS